MRDARSAATICAPHPTVVQNAERFRGHYTAQIRRLKPVSIKLCTGIERAGDSQPPTTGPSVQFADSMVFKLTYRSPLPSDERSRTRRATARLIALIAFPSLLVAAVAVPRSAAKIEAYRMQRDSEARQRELDELLSRTHLSVLTFEEPAGDSCSTPSSKPAAVMR
jgi:hypothetical protein